MEGCEDAQTMRERQGRIAEHVLQADKKGRFALNAMTLQIAYSRQVSRKTPVMHPSKSKVATNYSLKRQGKRAKNV